MASIVDICNLALSHVGGGRIVSLSDSTEEAAQCQLHYAFARDKVLGEREWTFAVVRRELGKTASPPDFGYPFEFQIPSDSIRVLSCFDQSHASHPNLQNDTNWAKEGNVIISDAERLWCKYIRRIEDPNLFTAGFIETVAVYLAHKICIPLTNNRGLSTELLNIYEAELAKAATADGMQGRTQQIRYSRLANARRR